MAMLSKEDAMQYVLRRPETFDRVLYYSGVTYATPDLNESRLCECALSAQLWTKI